MHADREQPSDFRKRRNTRVAVRGEAHMRREGLYSVEVRIRNVSQCGFMAECVEPVLIGSYISLDVPGIGQVRAQVRWQIGGRMGGMFIDPIGLNSCEWLAEAVTPPTES
ncbi:hypothetical protein [Allosphingosinicella humi]|jgi:hypothetical protein